jgi:hypothetical protein
VVGWWGGRASECAKVSALKRGRKLAHLTRSSVQVSTTLQQEPTAAHCCSACWPPTCKYDQAMPSSSVHVDTARRPTRRADREGRVLGSSPRWWSGVPVISVRVLTSQSVSQSVIKQIGAAPIFTRSKSPIKIFTRCGRATLTRVLTRFGLSA